VPQRSNKQGETREEEAGEASRDGGAIAR